MCMCWRDTKIRISHTRGSNLSLPRCRRNRSEHKWVTRDMARHLHDRSDPAWSVDVDDGCPSKHLLTGERPEPRLISLVALTSLFNWSPPFGVWIRAFPSARPYETRIRATPIIPSNLLPRARGAACVNFHPSPSFFLSLSLPYLFLPLSSYATSHSPCLPAPNLKACQEFGDPASLSHTSHSWTLPCVLGTPAIHRVHIRLPSPQWLTYFGHGSSL